jgi:alpha-glucosidase
MLGSALMLCPVVQPRARQRRVIFPAGDWYNFWTDEKITGGQTVTVDGPIDRLPLFVRGGSILPMGPAMQFIPDDHHFTDLQLHFYPPSDGSTTLFDAEPNTRAYLQGAYAETIISCKLKGNFINVNIEKPAGNARLVPPNRKLQLVFHDCKPAQQIRINHLKVENGEYDPQSRKMTVRPELINRHVKSLKIKTNIR